MLPVSQWFLRQWHPSFNTIILRTSTRWCFVGEIAKYAKKGQADA